MKRNNTKRIALAATLIAVLVLTTGCSGSKYSNEASTYNYMNDNYAGESYGYMDDYSFSKASTEASWNQEPLPSPAPSPAPDQSSNDNVPNGRKLIKTVSMRIETLSFETSRNTITSYASSLGGYIENSSLNNNTYDSYYNGYRTNRNANYTIRIPGSRLDEFLKAIGNVGNITYQTESTEDVTLKYLDVEARAKSLRIQQERLFALLEEANNIDDIISLNDRISEITYQLESNESILRNYDNLVEYSTVYITLDEVQRITEPEPETVGKRIAAGLSDTFYTISEGSKNFLVGFIVNLPLIIIWVAIIAICLFIIISVFRFLRKLRKKRLERQAARHAKLKDNSSLTYSASGSSSAASGTDTVQNGSDASSN